ncbi:hypothetical protein F7725_005057, partial [Dissostichus mawsoni]
MADILRLRAGLFCVFPYLDVRSLLRAAEVCSDWLFVARHPAVWTHLRLENARVSAEFLTTLSQWCTQTQSVVLQNLKPRSRRADETREDYHKNTRGVVEPGVEVLLRSAGGVCFTCLSLSELFRSSWSRGSLGPGCRLQEHQQPAGGASSPLPTAHSLWKPLPADDWSMLAQPPIPQCGRAGCGTQGLVALVRSCAQLQVLELERVSDLGLQAATALCEAGLK